MVHGMMCQNFDSDNAKKTKHSNGKYTGEEYDAIKVSQEVFWLITGYIPPYNYIPKDSQENLYSVCFILLHKIWHQYHQIMKYNGPRKIPENVEQLSFLKENEYAYYGTYTGISQGLHKNILEVRKELIARWDDDVEMVFLQDIQDVLSITPANPRTIYDGLFKFAGKLYNYKLKGKKTSFKGFEYAKDILYHALIDECFTLTGIHLYQRVFGLLASFNQTLWPI